MADKPTPGSYIDTQGMGAPLSPEEAAKLKGEKKEYKPMVVRPRRLHTPQMVKELKILINEGVDEREGKTGISYFDTEQFEHTVLDQEPPYTPYQ